MDLFIYSDESGVFDKAHNEIFVYDGLVFIGKQQKDEYAGCILRQNDPSVVKNIRPRLSLRPV